MNTYLRRFTYFLLLIFVFAACDNFEDVPPQTDKQYLVAQQEVASYSLIEINVIINAVALQYPDLAAIKDEFTSGVNVYKVTYNTTFNGETRLASGLVCLPTESGTYPVMSYQNGTNTLHSEAPSAAPGSNLFKLLEMMSSTGFVVVIPDYLGFGEADDMFHPYLDKESTVQTVLDMIKAVDEMVAGQEGIDLDNDLYINGYSQGGWATMAVQKAIDGGALNKFNLKASSCNAGPHYLVGFTDWLLSKATYPMPYFIAYLYNSYMNLGMTTPIDSIFQQPYADKVPSLFDGTKSGPDINAELTTTVADLFTPGFIENWNKGGIYESLYTMLEENSNAGYSTSTPMLLIHGQADTYVPSSMSSSLFTDFTSKGVSEEQIKLVLLPGMDHTDAIIPAGLASMKWFIEIKNQ